MSATEAVKPNALTAHSPASKIKEAVIIGYGSMGKRHAINLDHLGVRIVAVADPRFDSHLHTYKDAEECLEKHAGGRLVVVASPTPLHSFHAVKALYCDARAVFIEKPMCVNLPDADEICGLSQEMKIPITVGYNFRAHPGFHAMLKCINTPNFFFGAYGIDDPTTWPTFKRFGLNSYICTPTGGILWTSASHAVDMAITTLGPVNSLVATYTKAQSVVILRMFHRFGGVSTLYNKWMQGHDKTSLLTYTSVEDSITVDLLADIENNMHKDTMSNFLNSLITEQPKLMVPSVEELYHNIEVLVAAEKAIDLGERIII